MNYQGFGGKEGIRTLEALLTLTRFPGGPLQPLEHLSVWLDCKQGKRTTLFLSLRVQKYYLFLNLPNFFSSRG